MDSFWVLQSESVRLLIRWDALLVLDLGLDVADGVRRLDIEGDGLARQGLHEDLHTTTKTQHKMEGGLLLGVVVQKGAAVFQLLAGKDQTLLIRWDALLVLDLRLDVVDGVARLDIEGDNLARQGLRKHLHTTTKAQHEVEGALLLDVVVRKGATIFQLFAKMRRC